MKQFLILWIQFTFRIPLSPFLPSNWRAWKEWWGQMFFYMAITSLWISLTVTLPISAPLLALVQCRLNTRAARMREKAMQEFDAHHRSSQK
ncbi:membrane protein [Burkholderia phage BcepF1]|uniref:Membrane protein n=1 Tax=Burkholderia phage BcepF1 TaxID=2886897 RepID=A1YZQ7_9CAUD|nr:membrane protein [Burkholderia phage BcepF1]ABL96734.1 membrane protein [Burkholderia phage BcepF1]